MKTLFSYALVMGFTFSASAADFKKLETCYKRGGQLEETTKNGKKVTTMKSEEEVAMECNEEVTKQAKSEKDVKSIKQLASIIGRNSNWANALPVYEAGVKNGKKEICTDKEVLEPLDLALGRSAENKPAKEGLSFMSTCWPQIKDTLIGALPNSSGYSKDNICSFLKSKNGLPSDKASLCK